MSFLSELCSKTTLRQAWERVASKRGVAGIDRVSIEDFAANLDLNLQKIREEVRGATYRPLPVMRIRPRFLASSDRALVVPTVRDRVVHRAIADLLSPQVEPTLSPACRAFRKGFSAIGAAEDVGRWIERGTPWVLRADVKRFFDSIRPEALRSQLDPFVDAEGMRFLDRILRCRVFDHHQVSEMVVGIAQGSPLSPLLGNLYLSKVDQALRRDHRQTIRYCDDVIVLGSEEAEVRQAHEQLSRLIEPLGLELNEAKTVVCRAEDGFVFLGYRFDATGRGPAVKALEALRCRLDEVAGSDHLNLAEVDAIYRGWTNYFGDHPTGWTGSPAGILALLRGGKAQDCGTELAEARWGGSSDVSPQLALELARAWSAEGRPEQSWLELAMACGGSRASGTALAPWAHVLKADPDELEELARRLVGPPSDRLSVLTDAVAELGQYQAASQLAAFGDRFAAGLEQQAPESGEPPPASDADLRLLVDWFQGREGVHGEMALNRAGHRTIVPLHRPILEDDWRAHLAGEKCLALPLVRTGNTAFLGVFDVDVTKRALDERLGVPDELLGRALATALRLRAELERRGAPSLLEASGYKGHHVWVRLAEPVPCYRLRRWLLDVVRAIGSLPEGIRVEEFPNRDRVKPDAVGPLIKLPLGVHAKSGRRSTLLDQEGQPLADPFAAIQDAPLVSTELVCTETSPATDARPSNGVDAKIGPRCRRMLEGCRVLGYLAGRAQATAYLNHRERTTLLCTLGHLGEEGAATLHAIISQTYNYRHEVTERHIGRLPPWPMSCPKIRELHPEAMVSDTCSCQFSLRGGGYPTPLLYALKPSQVPAFRKRRSRSSSETGSGKARSAPQQASLGQGEELIRKIADLKRQRRGIEGAIARVTGELAELFDAAKTETLQLSMGTLRRVKPSAGESWDFHIEV